MLVQCSCRGQRHGVDMRTRVTAVSRHPYLSCLNINTRQTFQGIDRTDRLDTGLFQLTQLPIDAVPDITNRQVKINTVAAALAPEQMERQVTYPLETAMAGIPGLDNTRSLTRNGFSQVTVIFSDATDIYFISNRKEEAASARFRFRVTGKQPEFWNPLTGGIQAVTDYAIAEDTTSIPVSFPPYGSMFVVFRDTINNPVGTDNFPTYEPVLAIEGTWNVSFDEEWGGPGSVDFFSLKSWTEYEDAGIRYYSGTATYSISFDIPEDLYRAGETWVIDLGAVHEIASVRLNGKNLGVLWTPPFQTEITDVLHQNNNLLEIDIVNNWPNRLIGDAGIPEEQRLTRTNVTKFTADMPLTPSGLLGPVRLLTNSPLHKKNSAG